LGDHLLCLGIYREYAKKYSSVVIPATSNYGETLKALLSDLSNVSVVEFDFPIHDTRLPLVMESRSLILQHLGFDELRLGSFGPNFFHDINMRLDENYYSQANLDIDTRWRSFHIPRDLSREYELRNLLVPKNRPYIFVHDDARRNFNIRPELLPEGIIVIRPDMSLSKRFKFFDYLTLIEGAEEIHCIESSFAALIEGMQIQGEKFAHRYARPEALNDFRHEFTYKTDWKVIF
jgi:hypothetical protein